jgi:hypothetical protein
MVFKDKQNLGLKDIILLNLFKRKNEISFPRLILTCIYLEVTLYAHLGNITSVLPSVKSIN